MAELILNNLYLILLLPFWLFLIIIGGRFFSVYVNKNIIYSLTLLSTLLGGIFSLFSLIKFQLPLEQSFQFIKINDFIINFGVHIDKLSLIIATILFSVSFFVQLFSISYMKNESKNYRFFALLNLFNFSMAGLIFSPNLFQMYVFWEFVGIISYLLIGFEYNNCEKSLASKRVFLINRIGDTALVGAIILTSYFMYNYATNLSFATLSFEDMNAISTLLYAYTSTTHFYIIASLFIFSAIVKSAQFPFYIWLQDAMQAKLPVSALLHSATMVIAGVYLLIRLIPIFSLEQGLLNIILWSGILTAIICSLLACIETQPKKVLAYSTSANIGLMFLAIGLLNIKAGVILLIAHAFIKSMLFLALPQLEEKIRFINFIIFMLGALSLSGIAFSGMLAKEFLFDSLNQTILYSVLYCLISFLSAFYIIRLSLLIAQNKNLVKEWNYIEIFSMLGLLFFNIIFYLFIRKQITYQLSEPFWCALVAWVVVYFLYMQNKLRKFTNTPKILENLFYNKMPLKYATLSNFMKKIDEKVFANYTPIIISAKYGVQTIYWFEEKIMNGFVNLIVKSCKKISEIWSKLQTKNVQTYNAYAFLLITIIMSLIVVIYTYIANKLS